MLHKRLVGGKVICGSKHLEEEKRIEIAFHSAVVNTLILQGYSLTGVGIGGERSDQLWRVKDLC